MSKQQTYDLLMSRRLAGVALTEDDITQMLAWCRPPASKAPSTPLDYAFQACRALKRQGNHWFLTESPAVYTDTDYSMVVLNTAIVRTKPTAAVGAIGDKGERLDLSALGNVEHRAARAMSVVDKARDQDSELLPFVADIVYTKSMTALYKLHDGTYVKKSLFDAATCGLTSEVKTGCGTNVVYFANALGEGAVVKSRYKEGE